jgi:hypothetical protein
LPLLGFLDISRVISSARQQRVQVCDFRTSAIPHPHLIWAVPQWPKAERSKTGLDGPSANADAGRTSEKVSLNLSDDGKTLFVLYAYDVGNGVTDPIPLTVHSKTKSYVVAAGQQLLGETAVILDVKSWKAVISFTGQGMLGIKGSSLLLQCH